MKCLLEQGVFENENDILKTLADMKISHSLWDHKSYPPYDPKVEKDVFFLGSNLTAQNLKNAKYPYHISIGEEYNYSYWGAHIKEIFNWSGLMSSAGRLLNMYANRNPKYDQREHNMKMFFRSNSGNGLLKGGPRTTKEIIPELNYLFPHEIVVMAEDEDVVDEYRCVVEATHKDDGPSEYQVLTSSSYIIDGKRCTNYKLLDQSYQDKLVGMLKASTYRAPRLFMCDVHIDDDGELSVMDVKSANCSNFYGCDLVAFFDGVKQIVDET